MYWVFSEVFLLWLWSSITSFNVNFDSNFIVMDVSNMWWTTCDEQHVMNNNNILRNSEVLGGLDHLHTSLP